MKKSLRNFLVISVLLILSPILLGINLSAQTPLSFSIKTHPVQWFYGFRPNINLELRFNERHALTAEIMWKTKIWRAQGGEIFPGLQKGKGYRIALGGRYYFPSSDKNEPRDWFFELQLRYDLKDANFVLDTQRSIALFFGKQFNFGEMWAMEQYLGINLYHWKTYYQKNDLPKFPLKYTPKKVNGSAIFYRPIWGGLLNYNY